jgi:AMP nucleosidase
MKNKSDIVDNWLPRYTGTPLDQFGQHILLTNFGHYVELFAQWHGVEVKGRDRPMPNATADGITMINFGMGSPNAATVMDCCPRSRRRQPCSSASAAGSRRRTSSAT